MREIHIENRMMLEPVFVGPTPISIPIVWYRNNCHIRNTLIFFITNLSCSIKSSVRKKLGHFKVFSSLPFVKSFGKMLHEKKKKSIKNINTR